MVIKKGEVAGEKWIGLRKLYIITEMCETNFGRQSIRGLEIWVSWFEGKT